MFHHNKSCAGNVKFKETGWKDTTIQNPAATALSDCAVNATNDRIAPHILWSIPPWHTRPFFIYSPSQKRTSYQFDKNRKI